MLDGDALPFDSGLSWLSNLFVYPWYDAGYRLLTGWDWLVARFLGNAWGPAAPSFTQATLAQFERPFRVDGTAGELRTLVSDGVPGVTRNELAQIKVPRTVIWGADDTVDSLTSGRATAAALGVPLDLIPGAGHLTMLSKPTSVARLILSGAPNVPSLGGA